MTFKYDITDAEFAEYVKNIYRKSWSLNGNGWKYIAFILVIIGVNVYTSVSRQSEAASPSSYLQPLLNWVLLIAVFGIVWFLVMKFMSKNSENKLKTGRNNTQSKPQTWLYVLIGGGLFLGYLYFSSNQSMEGNGEDNTPSYMDSLLSWAFLVCLIGGAWIFILRRLTSVNRFKPEDRETLLGEREMTFNEDKLTTKNRHTESIFRWEAIKKWEQTTNLYLLFITDNSAFIMPKRIFENEEQQAEFEQLIKRKLPNLTSEKYLDA
jgi:YcxB-like protein